MKKSILKHGLQDSLKLKIKNRKWHAKWLNTLSMMETSGAQKIFKCPFLMKGEFSVLHHAKDEAFHGYYLKQWALQLNPALLDYSDDCVWGGFISRRYLDLLDLGHAKFLVRECGVHPKSVYFPAYLLTTYAIEVRAQFLYPSYQKALDELGQQDLRQYNYEEGVMPSLINIVQDEKQHLKEIKDKLREYFSETSQRDKILNFAEHLESEIFHRWANTVIFS